MSTDRKTTDYIQCALARLNHRHMAWIPEQFAKVGRFLKIKKGDTFEDGWEVVGAASSVVLSSQDANMQSQLYKKTRKASDI